MCVCIGVCVCIYRFACVRVRIYIYIGVGVCGCVCRWVGDRDWPLRNFNVSEVHCDGGTVTSPSSSPASAASCAGVHGLCNSWAVKDFAGGGAFIDIQREGGGFIQSKRSEGGGFMLRYGPQELGLDGTVQRKNALERWREQRARDDLEVREEAGGGEEGKEGEEGGGRRDPLTSVLQSG